MLMQAIAITCQYEQHFSQHFSLVRMIRHVDHVVWKRACRTACRRLGMIHQALQVSRSDPIDLRFIL